MIGLDVTSDKDGNPIAGGKQLTLSTYQPSDEVQKLFARCQADYSQAWRLQHRPFDEFDGYSLLERTRKDQQTFGAFVGASYVAEHKRWRWRGRKNTARNKMIGILAHMISGMLFPIVYAFNEKNEEDKTGARVVSILIEEHLRKANYETKFLYFVLSALVNPAVIVKVEYLYAMQKIKEKLANGTVNITEAVDEIISGLQLNIKPIDQILLADFYVNDIQQQPYLVDIQRVSYDTARKIWGDHEDFQYVEAGKTRVFIAGNERSVLYDIEWTEADRTAVQVATFYYRPEDLQVTFVGGVFMDNKTDVYNTNPFKHRRMALVSDEWKSVPVYEFAKSYFEPIDPSGRFAYGKSSSFKQFWDDATQNALHQLRVDAAKLEAIKPLFISGAAKVDSIVIAPGAVTGMPANAKVDKYDMATNFAALVNTESKQEDDMSESTIAKILEGQIGPRMTAFAYNAILTNAKILFGVFGALLADLLRQIGELSVDCVIQHATMGELEEVADGSLVIRYKTLLAKTKEGGRSMTHRIMFDSNMMGKQMSEAGIRKAEFDLFDKAGGSRDSDQRIWKVNPYRLARMRYAAFIDVDRMLMRTMDLSRHEKDNAFAHLANPLVAPYIDMQAVVDDFVIEPYGGDDPDKYKVKGKPNLPQLPQAEGNKPPQAGQDGAAIAIPALSGVMNPVIR